MRSSVWHAFFLCAVCFFTFPPGVLVSETQAQTTGGTASKVVLSGDQLSLVSASVNAEGAGAAIDGNAGTYWTAIGGLPQEIVIELEESHHVTAIRYVHGSRTPNYLTQYRIYASEDGTNWVNTSAPGTIKNTATVWELRFSCPKDARFINLSWDREASVSSVHVGEIQVISDSVTTPPAPPPPVQQCSPEAAVGEASSALYVDKDNPACSNSGSGTEAQPLCSIQAAVSKAVPGTAIRIGEASTPYNETIAITKSGTAGKPIILEAAPGQKPVITNHDTGAYAGISVRNVEYVVIRGLTLDGAGGATPKKAIGIDGGSKYRKGIGIENVTVLNWNSVDRMQELQSVIVANKTDGAIIRNNSLRDSRGEAIALRSSYRGQVYGNLITGVKCDSVQYQSGRQTTMWRGIKINLGDGKGADGPSHHVIHDNVIANFDRNCRNSYKQSGGGIWCDAGVSHGEVYNNRIINTAPNFGIQIESRCHNWNVHDNLIADARGITKANFGTRNAVGTRFQNNISCGGARAFQISESPNTVITGNMISGAKDEIGSRSNGNGGKTTINGTANPRSLSSNNEVTGNAAICQNVLAAPLSGYTRNPCRFER